MTTTTKVRDYKYMDPKQNAQLDPKLQEAYNRVMGTPTIPSDTTTPSVAAPQAISNSSVAPVGLSTSSPATLPAPDLTQPSTTPNSPTSPIPVATPIGTSQNTTPSLATPTSSPPSPIVMPHSTETVRVGGSAPAPSSSTVDTTVAKEKKKGISPVLIIVGAIVFLLVYTLFWVKFLNVPIPFLSQ